jgi:hypothetical protein
MSDTGWVYIQFPGNGNEIPNDAERDRADEIIAMWSGRWHEDAITIARVYPASDDENSALAGQPTNRAYLRSRLRRWWVR